jgi:phosphoribosylanthranilate isomerase
VCVWGRAVPIVSSVRVKFCGITRVEDAVEAVRLGAWAVGINHWEPGQRRCDPAIAAEIGAAVKRKAEVVGVFVNSTLDEIARAAEDESLSLIQLHGDEGLQFCREASRRTGCGVIKALRVRSRADVQAARSFRVDYHLLDAHRAGVPGGTGESFDWDLLAARRSDVPLIVAGGLRPGNVGEAIAVTRPFAVDVASGVEAEPGVKDHELMAAFSEAANAAGAELGAIA